MALTTQQQINIGRVCSILASEELNQGKPRGGQLDEFLPLQLYAITEGLEMLYDLDSVNADLTPIGNDLISKCRHYSQAVSKLNPGGSIPSISNPSFIVSPILIRGVLFASQYSWSGENYVSMSVLSSYTLQVFYNPASRFLTEGNDWTRTATGFDIVLGTTFSAFDALGSNSSDEFYVYISV